MGRISLRSLGYAAVLAVAALITLAVWTRPGSTQWDLTIYLHAARAEARGLDPYRVPIVETATAESFRDGYVYPPATLAVFRLLDRGPAARIWLVLKLAAAVFLYLLWRRTVLRGVDGLLVAGVLVLGMNGALLWDLRSGNVALFEILLLWAGFAAFLSRRYVLFALLVAAASIWKLLPLVFLGLLFLPDVPSRRRRIALPVGLAAFAVVAGLPLILEPELGKAFLHALSARRPHGDVNPSSLGILDGLTALVPGLPGWTGPVLWGGFAAGMLVAGRRLLRRAFRGAPPADALLVSVLLYAVLIPRLMIYSYVLLLPALLVLGLRWVGRGPGVAFLAAVLCLQGVARIPPLELGGMLTANLPYLILLGFWIALIRSPAPIAGAREPSAPSPRPA
jgi:hypothetical protein